MSYPLDIDEMSTRSLEEELHNRRLDYSVGKCDYCHRPYDVGMCKFPRRHSGEEHA